MGDFPALWFLVLIPVVLHLPGIIWAIASSRANPVYGVGGWLVILIYSLYVVVPLASVLTTASTIGNAEHALPGLADMGNWQTYKLTAWVSTLGMSVFSVITGHSLHKKLVPATLRLAKAYLWSVPAVSLITAWIAHETLNEPIGYQLGRVLGLAAIVGIWHAYLSSSLRVAGTYGLRDTSSARHTTTPAHLADGNLSDSTGRRWSVSASSVARTNGTSASMPLAVQRQPTAQDMDEPLYEMVGKELQSGDHVLSTWTRAFADSGGDENKARALYIQLRVERLRIERREKQLDAERQSKSKAQLAEEERAEARLDGAAQAATPRFCSHCGSPNGLRATHCWRCTRPILDGDASETARSRPT